MNAPTPLLLGLWLACLAVDASPSSAAGPSSRALPADSRVVVTDSVFDANELRMSVSNVGRFAHPIQGPTSQSFEIPVSYGVKVDVYQASSVTATFSDATRAGLVTVVSEGHPVYPPMFEGVDWGGRFFGGGLDTGCRWSGSSIVGNKEDLAICPGATLAPERFKSVYLDGFGGHSKAYRYFRRELPSGAEPAVGRGYTYQGYVDIPFSARTAAGTPLQLMFTERQITDDTGDPTGLAQPESQNGIWYPTFEADGGHEYINVLDLPASDVPDPLLAQDGRFFSSVAPVLYGGRLRQLLYGSLRAGVAFIWVDGADRGPGLDAAWAPITFSGALGYFLSNGDGSSRLFSWFGARSLFIDLATAGSGTGGARSAAWGDFNGDGLVDLFTAGAGTGSRLLHQSSSGFGETMDPTLTGSGTTVHAAWADYDLDGDLDLFLSDRENGRLMRNDGAAGFVNATPFLLSISGGIRATWVDYDGDLDPDLCLCNGVSQPQLFRNDRVGFAFATPPAFSGIESTLDTAWGDYDGDGDQDVLLARDFGGDLLLRNDGAAGFADVTPSLLTGYSRGRRAAWADFDLDGDLDLALAFASSGFHVVRNDGNGAFSDATYLPYDAPTTVNAAALADYDDDGDMDVLLTSTGPDFLARNDLNGGRWIRVALEGTRSQRQGIGARIRVVVNGVAQVRYVTAADPPPLAATFGLGGGALADTVEVDWPSGAISRMTAVPAFSRVVIQENYAPPSRLAFARVSPNPSQGSIRIDLLVPAGTQAADLRVHDLSGRMVWSRQLTGLRPGVHLVAWDGTDHDGRVLPAGIYFIRASHSAGSASARIVLIR